MNATVRTLRREDPRPQLITRALAVRAATINEKARSIDVVLATDNPVRVYDWDLGIVEEVLRMDGVELPAQLPLLADHNTYSIESIRGSLRNLRVEGGILVGTAVFAEDEASERAWQKVRGGHLTDLSVGYTIDQATRVVIAPGKTEIVGGRSYTAGTSRLVITTRWAPYEGSLVPIGADAAAKFRSHHPHPTNRATAPKEHDMTFEQWLKARGINPEAINTEQRAALQADFEKMNRSAPPAPPAGAPAGAPAGDEATRAKELADLRERNAKLERAKKLRSAATAFGVDATDAELENVASVEAGYELLQQRKAAADQGRDQPGAPVGGITIGRHEADKFLARAHAGFMAGAGHEVKGEWAGSRMLSTREIIARCALYDGHGDARDWSEIDLCSYAAARARYVRSGGPNKTTSMFSTLLSNVAEKLLLAGFDGFDDITYEDWCTVGETSSFKQFTVAGLSSALMQIVAEGMPAPELKQKDGGYSSRLSVFGGTISLSFQTIVDDELNEFGRSASRIGANAKRTIEVEAFRSLLNADWTYDETGAATLATEGNLDKVRAAYRAKLNPVGQPMNNSPRFLIHDPANAVNAQKATGQIYAPGQTMGVSTGSKAIRCIESALVSDTTLKAGVLTTDYYLAGDPRLVDTVRVTFLQGVRQPFFMEYDTGTVFGSGFKFFMPLAATVATHTDKNAHTRVTGAQRAKVA